MTRRQRRQERRAKRRRKREPDDVPFALDDEVEPGFEDEYPYDGEADYIPEDGFAIFDDLDPYDLPRNR